MGSLSRAERVLTAVLGGLVAGFAPAAPALATSVSHHTFAFRFGLEVNQTKVTAKAEGQSITEAEENICTAVSEDICQEGVSGESAGAFDHPDHLSVSESTGDVYVTDEENHRVEVFGADGDFVAAWGWGVRDGTAEYQICTSGCRAGIAGVGAGQFREPKGIAIDNSDGALSGDVYVADAATNTIQVFSTAGTFLAQFTQAGAPSAFDRPNALAVSATTGLVYVSDEENRVIDEFTATPTAQGKPELQYAGQIASANLTDPSGVAVDNSGTVYVTSRGQVLEFNSSGAFEREVTTEAGDVAVDPHTGDVYIPRQTFAPTKNLIEVYEADGALLTNLEFGVNEPMGEDTITVNGTTGSVYTAADNDVTALEASPLPGVDTDRATDVVSESATLHGSVEPGGLNTSYVFEYGTTSALGSDVPAPAGDAGSSSGVVSVSVTLADLQPGATYYYRLSATDELNTSRGAIKVFRTGPVVRTAVPTSVTQTSAVLAGEVDPEGAATTYGFTYVSASECAGGIASYGDAECTVRRVPESEGAIEAGTGTVPVAATLGSLKPTSAYYYAVTASNGTEVVGQPRELVLLPGARTLGPGEVRESTGVIVGSVDPPGASTTYRFEYGSSTAYGTTVPTSEASAGSASGFHDVSVELSGLELGKTYHYRIMASTTGGTTYGEDETFTTTVTEPYPMAPTATTGPVTNVFSSGATLTGTVRPEGYGTTYSFEYGPTAYYGAIAPLAGGSAGSGTDNQAVAEALVGLQPSTTYHYRLVTSNAGGTAYGADETLTTPAATVAPVVSAQSTAPTHFPAAVMKKKILTTAEKLKAALKYCRRESGKHRGSCEMRARKKDGVKPKARSKKTTKADGKVGR
jgi:phosphodiesterase/alkaline phosphatase D-like protein